MHGRVRVQGSVDFEVDRASSVNLKLSVVQIIRSSKRVKLIRGAVLYAESLQSGTRVVVAGDGCVLVARTSLVRGKRLQSLGQQCWEHHIRGRVSNGPLDWRTRHIRWHWVEHFHSYPADLEKLVQVHI